MALKIGEVIDEKYRVVQLIGEGGMGAVYEGENVRIRRRVAIKTLHALIASNEEVVVRFEREAQAAGRIGSDHILEVLDLGALPNGDRFIVMEFLDGEPLAKRIERLGRLTPDQLMPIVRQLLDGLGAAHAAGIVHRDLKPDNIFILRQKAGRQDFVKIIDFGISKFQSDQQSMAMTRTGTMMGTPLYMSPEQANGSADADARSDVYAIGVIMYEALTGATPFTARSFNELLFQIVLMDINPVHAVVPSLDAELGAIVARAMARDRNARFQSTAELQQALDDWQARAGLGSAPRPVIGQEDSVAKSQIATITGSQPTPTAHQTPWPGAVGASGGATINAWGDTSREEAAGAAPPKSKAPIFGVIALTGLIALGGGGFAVSRVLHGSSPGSGIAESVVEQPSPPPPVHSAKPVETTEPVESAAPPPSASITASVAPKETATAPKPTASGASKPTSTANTGGKKPVDWGY